ncbi:MAG: hypothetical protein ACKVT2_04930 [Saprospiraceae bacterium]
MTFSNQNLDLDLLPGGTQVAVRVSYTVTFSPDERQLVALGTRFREDIAVLENDFGEIIVPPGGSAPAPDVLANFGARIIGVTAGNSNQVINRPTRTIIVPRSALNEDPPGLDPDEIRCRITIRPIDFPLPGTSFTDTETLP